MKKAAIFLGLLLGASAAQAQIQVQLKFSRLQYIAYEPLIATVSITNRAGRDIDLHDDAGQSWFDFEVTGGEDQNIGPLGNHSFPALRIEAGRTVTQKINLTPLFAVQDLGTYHIRAHIYFADLGKYFYSAPRAVQVINARAIWRQSVGVPDSAAAPGEARTYSLLTNRFPDHTSLYVRVEDENRNIVYATYPLGHLIDFDEPRAETDRENRLHVLFCAAPRVWSYSIVGLNGQLVSNATLMETRTRPRLQRAANGDVSVVGGMSETGAAQSLRKNVPKLSTRPSDPN